LILVRLLLFLALAAIGVAAILYLYKRDRRYLRFIGQVIKFAILLLAIVLIFFAFERIVGPMLSRGGGRSAGAPQESLQRGLERPARQPSRERRHRLER